MQICRQNNWDSNTELLLVVSHWKDNLLWLTSQNDFPYVVGKKKSSDTVCGVPVNKGAEGSTYLKFIVNNWDNLPKRICFLDEHEQSWHQPFDMIARLRDLRKDGLPDKYFPLNDWKIDSNQKFRDWRFVLFSPVWNAVVEPHLKMKCPRRIICDGSAQFIVTRELIKANSLELFNDLFHYTIGSKRWKSDTEWKDAKGFSYSPGGQDWVGGNYFLEWIWHIIFGEPAILPKYYGIKHWIYYFPRYIRFNVAHGQKIVNP